MKWLDTAAPALRVVLRLVAPMAAGLLAAQLTLHGLPAECAAQVGDLAVKLFGS